MTGRIDPSRRLRNTRCVVVLPIRRIHVVPAFQQVNFSDDCEVFFFLLSHRRQFLKVILMPFVKNIELLLRLKCVFMFLCRYIGMHMVYVYTHKNTPTRLTYIHPFI